ncbi:HNH endonuclease [Clostridium tagluense]|nr:HNH endonuclease [Clostridium tagluense]MCB2312182.1 HNH endonuclease [Clostridium tagluense]
MSFPEKIRTKVLLKCKRYCCYCEQYKGRDIEVHHIVQKADGGEDTFDNAIPLCYDCHSEIGSYNPHHPKGNRFRPDELKKIRDDFYIKIASIPRKIIVLSEDDEKLLSELKEDYTQIIEYAVCTDFSSELVEINYSDSFYYLEEEKWSRKKYTFSSINLENLKNDILENFKKLRYYLSDVYLRYHENSGKLIFRNQSWEEGCRLREELQPETIKIRTELNKLLQQLYMY